MIEQERLLSNPFPGLRPFETDENYLFFGRDGQSDQVLTKLRTSRFVAVVGTSGSGKSSLVRAGLLPALFSGHMTSAGSSWRIAVFRPGKSPISNLAQAFNDSGVFATRAKEDASVRLANIERTLRRSSLGLLEVVTQARMDPNENLLILADQFEELFRFRKKSTDEHPEDEAAAFVKLLLETKQQDRPPEERLPIYVILTMRSDYLGDCAHFWGLPEAINEGQYLIPRMTDDDRREAITGPVIIGGGEITAPLVNRLLNDAGDDPAQLPILQHALMRTWNYWKTHGNTSTPIEISHYESIGGMLQALSNHADEAFWELSPESQRVAEKLFKCITEKEADSREGRRPATVGEICAVTEADEDQVKAVIESFRSEGRSFLMPPPNVPLTTDTLIDISHESLIRGWQRLREWVDKEAQSARQYMRLADTASRFPEEEGFLRDPALHLGLKWLEDNRPTKAWAVRYHPGFDKTIEYLEASKANREAEIAEKERQQKEEVERELRHAEAMATEQKRRVKLLRLGMLVLLILLLAMLGLTVFAFQQKRVADALRKVAEHAVTEVEVQRDNAQEAKDEADRQRARAEGALITAQRDRKEAETQRDIARKAQRDAVIQARVAENALAETKRQRDKADKAQASAVAAKKEAETERDNAKQALEAVNEIDSSADFFKAIMRGHTQEIDKAVFSPDGSMVISTSLDLTTRVWDSQTGKPKPIWQPSANSVVSADHTAIGNVLVSNTGDLMFMVNDSGSDRYGVIWDVRANKELGRFKGPQENARFIFSPNDKFIAQNDHLGRTTIYDARTAKEISNFSGGANENDMVFSPDGKRLVIASADASATVWDVATGKQVARLLGHLGEV
ncbi:MAG TPA: hypothetical protein VGV87_06470, partial [Blastocatellia bacterium]|nr:hypothetical protein [Blastocatellia bacterium]